MNFSTSEIDPDVIRNQLRHFIENNLIHQRNYNLKDDEGLISGGLIHSFTLVELGLFIEETFDLYVPDADLTKENFDTLNQVVEYVSHALTSQNS